MSTPYEILQENNNYTVIGLNNDQTKFAHRIYTLLKKKGKSAFGIHPTLSEVNDNEKVYPTLEAVPSDLDVAVFVVNPKIGITYLDAIVEKGIPTIWLQPGTVSDELVTKAKSLDLNVIEDCVLAVYAKNEPV